MYGGRFARRAAAFLLSARGAYAPLTMGMGCLRAAPGIVDWLLHTAPSGTAIATGLAAGAGGGADSAASSSGAGAAAASHTTTISSIVPSASSRPVSGFVGFAAHRSAMRRAITGASFRSRSASSPCSNALRSSRRPGAVHSDKSSPRSHLSTNCLNRLLRRFGSTTALKNAGSFSCRKKSSSCEA